MSAPDPELSERLANLTLELCKIPSVTGEEAAISADIEARLLAIPELEVSRLGPTVMAQTGGEGPLIVLYGHTDTVAPKAQDPEPHRDGDQLFGLGASDMKAGLAVMLLLAEKWSSKPRRCRLGLVFYDAEEGPWFESGLGPALAGTPWLHDAVLSICLEPSDNVVQVGCVGSLHATVTFRGQAAHSARPWQGRNAIQAAGPMLSRLAARAPTEVEAGGFVFREVMSATLAHGGIGRNVIPDSFELNLNYRFAPGRELDDAQAVVRELVADEADVRFTDLAPSGRVVTDNSELSRLLDSSGAALAPKQAWTDVARLSAAGLDGVNFGPGLAAQAHQAREYASLARVVEGYLMLDRYFSP